MQNREVFNAAHFTCPKRALLQIALMVVISSVGLGADQTVNGNLTVTGETTLQGMLISTSNHGLLFDGTLGSGSWPTYAVQGDSIFMWSPKTASIRAGYFPYLGALGGAALYSTAFGYESEATGENSTGLSGGLGTGYYATAISYGYASGPFSTAVAGGEAEGDRSFAASGGYVWNITQYSSALSDGGVYGSYATAMSGGQAEGIYSTAISLGLATGGSSVAMGEGAWAQASYSVAVGRFTKQEDIEENGQWIGTHPLFVIGNGTSEQNRRNALTVLKNGKVSIFGGDTGTPSIVLDPNTPQITVDGQALLVPNSSGNFGIGTSSPLAKLDVRGNVSIGNSTSTLFTANTTTGKVGVGGSANPDYRMTVTGGLFSYGQFLVHNNLFQDGGNWVSFNSISGGFYVAANGVNVLAIPSAGAGSGNVGIGSGAPAAKLQVVGPSSSPNNAFFVTTNTWTTGSAGSGVRIGTGATSGNTYGVLDVLQAGGASANGILAVNPQGGNVGIGTTTPTAKLEVNGDIKAAGVIHAQPGGDLSMGDFTASP